MVINMWSTGELKREFRAEDAKVYMVITRPLEPRAIKVVIAIDTASVYYPEMWDNPVEHFYQYLPLYHEQAVVRLGLPDDMKTIKRYIEYVQDGIDDFLKQNPLEEYREKKVIGEIDVSHGDLKFTKELKR